MQKLIVGQKYPIPINSHEGAAAQLLLQGGSFIQIFMPGLLDSEKKLLKKEKMYAGIIVDQPMILFMIKFGDLIFECPFDARIIPKDLLSLNDITNEKQRLFVVIQVIDTNTNILKVLRGITFSPELTLQLYLSAQDQLANIGNFEETYMRYGRKNVEELAKLANLSLCGAKDN